jgi:hypothetical protein
MLWGYKVEEKITFGGTPTEKIEEKLWGTASERCIHHLPGANAWSCTSTSPYIKTARFLINYVHPNHKILDEMHRTLALVSS